jgi:hypothetical protein
MICFTDVGLISYSGGTLTLTTTIDERRLFCFKKTGLVLCTVGKVGAVIQAAKLTTIGKEIYLVISPLETVEVARRVADNIPKTVLEQIDYVNLGESRDGGYYPILIEAIWKKQSELKLAEQKLGDCA